MAEFSHYIDYSKIALQKVEERTVYGGDGVDKQVAQFVVEDMGGRWPPESKEDEAFWFSLRLGNLAEAASDIVFLPVGYTLESPLKDNLAALLQPPGRNLHSLIRKQSAHSTPVPQITRAKTIPPILQEHGVKYIFSSEINPSDTSPLTVESMAEFVSGILQKTARLRDCDSLTLPLLGIDEGLSWEESLVGVLKGMSYYKAFLHQNQQFYRSLDSVWLVLPCTPTSENADASRLLLHRAVQYLQTEQ